MLLQNSKLETKQLAQAKRQAYIKPAILLLSTLSTAMLSIQHAAAWKYELSPEWKLEANTTLGLGTQWSMASADQGLVYKPDANHVGKPGQSVDVNGDDGHINFKKYDVISQIIKGYSEFKLTGKQQGAVLSTKYWYDHAYETGRGDLKPFDDTVAPRLAKFKGIDLWDAYVWKKFEFDNGRSLDVSVGKHRLNWGKSQFFQNGLNSVNAYDYVEMNRPGSDPRARVIPTEMVSFAAQLSDRVKIDGFYQLRFRHSVGDTCGTFFGASDFVPENCGPIILTIMPGDKLTESAIAGGTYIPRTGSHKAKNSGQYGMSLKWNISQLKDAELGVYYANYHSRNPHFNGIAVTQPGPDHFNTASYFSIYPENIDMYGLSLAGKVGQTAIFSELNHKPNQPLQLNGTDTVYAQVLDPNTPYTEPGVRPELGEHLQGYVRSPVTQFSIGASRKIPNLLGAEAAVVTAEAGVNHISDIGNHRFGRIGAFGRSPLSSGAYDPQTHANQCTPYGTAHLSDAQIDAMNARFCKIDGFFTEWSSGYRLHASLSYPDLIPKAVIRPSLAFRHDVHGYSVNFQEGQMAVSAALSAEFNQYYSAELSYHNFFGNNDFSVLDDRDFLSLSFKASF